MNLSIKNEITLIEARIQQYRDSELFSQERKEIKIKQLEAQLERLQLELCKNIEVINPEILS